ncbi:MAG: hypothetical protein Q4B71_00155 [Cardiobacteriaceae bacterium]|nr:hypothetical protein [Cardiobacteriaceae bacterium]
MNKLHSFFLLTLFFALAAGILFLSLRGSQFYLHEAQTISFAEPLQLEYNYRQSRNGDDERPENDISFTSGEFKYLIPCRYDNSGLCAFMKSQSKQQDFATTEQKALFRARLTLPAHALTLVYYYDNGIWRHGVVGKALYQGKSYEGNVESPLAEIRQSRSMLEKALPLALIALGIIYLWAAIRLLTRASN